MNTAELDNDSETELVEQAGNQQKEKSEQDWEDQEDNEQAVEQPEQESSNCLICPCCLQNTSHFQKIHVYQQAQQYPFNCIGKVVVINVSNLKSQIHIEQIQSTGFLVADGVLMTAASCVTSFSSLINGDCPLSMIFFEIWDEKGNLRWYKVRLWAIHSKFLQELPAYDVDSYDMALLILQDSSVKLNRQLKLNFTLQNYTQLKIVTCPSNDSKLYQSYIQNIEEQMEMMIEKDQRDEKLMQTHMQLIGKRKFQLQNYTCGGLNCNEEVVEGFAGSPLLREFTNSQGKKDYEVVGFLRKYETIVWWLWIRVLLNQDENQFIDFCRLITKNENKFSKQDLTMQMKNLEGKLLVFQCLSQLPEGTGSEVMKKIRKYGVGFK